MDTVFLILEVGAVLFLAAVIWIFLIPHKRSHKAVLSTKEIRENKVMMTFRTENVPQFTLCFDLGEKNKTFIVSQAFYESVSEGCEYQITWNKDQLICCETENKISEA